MSIQEFILPVLVPAAAVGGFYYGIYTGRLIDFAAYGVVVLSAEYMCLLIAPVKLVSLVCLATYVAAFIGFQHSDRDRPIFNPRWSPLAIGFVVLFDALFWGAYFANG